MQYRARNEEQHQTSNSHIFLAELIERGTGHALARLSKQFVSFSPMFEVFSTQIYRHSILNNPHFQWRATYCHWTWLRNIADLIQCSSICWPEHLPSGAPPLPPLAVGQSSVHAALSGRGILGKTVQGVLNIECVENIWRILPYLYIRNTISWRYLHYYICRYPRITSRLSVYINPPDPRSNASAVYSHL